MTQEEHLRRQAWDYFALHAQQRLTTLNFYLVLASALSAAAVASFQNDFRFPWLRLPAGLLLSLLSFAFWRLDLRNRELIKAAEAALRAFEMEHKADDGRSELPPERLFSLEDREAAKRKKDRGWQARAVPHSYSDVFAVLFASFFVAGILIALVSVW